MGDEEKRVESVSYREMLFELRAILRVPPRSFNISGEIYYAYREVVMDELVERVSNILRVDN